MKHLDWGGEMFSHLFVSSDASGGLASPIRRVSSLGGAGEDI